MLLFLCVSNCGLAANHIKNIFLYKELKQSMGCEVRLNAAVDRERFEGAPGVVDGLAYNHKSPVLTFSMRLGISLGNLHLIGWWFFGPRPCLKKSP